MTKTIVLVGGSFHGKSLIALQIAQNFKIPSIICTDSVRNMLNVTYPNRPYLSTSTYRLSSTELNKQFKHVSNVLRQMMPIYEKRGESTVLEEIHKQIMKYFTRHKLPIIKFNTIEVATQKITALIKNLIKS